MPKKSVNTIVVSSRTRSWSSASRRNRTTSGAPMCATTTGSRGCRASSRCIDAGPVKSLPTGPEPACTRIGTSASSSSPHTSSSSGSSRWNSPTCRCSLNSSTPAADQLSDVRRHAVLREERRRPQHLGHVGGEGARPVVEVGRHAGLVGVGQRREAAYAHRAQQLDAVLVRRAVADRPLAADLRAGGVEDVPRPPSGCWAAGSARARRRGRAARAPPRRRGPARRPRPGPVRRVSHPSP